MIQVFLDEHIYCANNSRCKIRPKIFTNISIIGYVNELFIGFQHAISMELVELMTGQSLKDFTVHINRYPHPPYVQDLAVEALMYIFPMFIMLSFSYTAVNIIRTITIEKELQLKVTTIAFPHPFQNL